MRDDCLEEGLLPSKVKSTEFESGRLTAPGFNGFRMDSLKGVPLELTVPAPLDCVLHGVSQIGKPDELENLDCTETLGAPRK